MTKIDKKLGCNISSFDQYQAHPCPWHIIWVHSKRPEALRGFWFLLKFKNFRGTTLKSFIGWEGQKMKETIWDVKKSNQTRVYFHIHMNISISHGCDMRCHSPIKCTLLEVVLILWCLFKMHRESNCFVENVWNSP